jgi:predicted Zn finger-like uncharacterized protein
MVLATRCPHCETVFRVQAAELVRSRGLVRCGHCNEVFDASQSLLDPSAAAAIGIGANMGKQESPVAPVDAGVKPPDQPRVEPHEPPATPAPPVAPENHSTTDQQPPSTFADIVADELREPTLGATAAAIPAESPHAPQEPATPPASVPPERPADGAASETYARPRTERSDEPKLPLDNEPSRAWHTDPEPRFQMPPTAEPGIAPAGPSARFGVPPLGPADGRVRPFEVTRERRARARRHAWLLFVGAFVALALLVLLVVQLAWWRREAVMVYWPASQSLFTGACARLGCQISPPRDIDGLQVQASDLRQVDGPHRLELRVPLHNRYSIALAYPAIELTLFDEKNEVAIRRVLWPQDYAPPGTPIAAGLPPHATQTMIVRLDSGNAVATNFRVQIFYP